MSNARTLANTINSSSQIVVPSGGIAFTDLDSSNDAATANEAYVMGQDGYEIGTWEPTYVPQTNSFSDIDYSVQEGYYTKIGNMVNARFFMRITSLTKGTATGRVDVGGLPFFPANARASATVWSHNFLDNHPSVCQVSTNGRLFLYYRDAADGSSNNLIQVSDLDTGNTDNSIIASICYQTD